MKNGDYVRRKLASGSDKADVFEIVEKSHDNVLLEDPVIHNRIWHNVLELEIVTKEENPEYFL